MIKRGRRETESQRLRVSLLLLLLTNRDCGGKHQHTRFCFSSHPLHSAHFFCYIYEFLKDELLVLCTQERMLGVKTLLSFCLSKWDVGVDRCVCKRMCGVSEVRPPAALEDCRALTVSCAYPLMPLLVHDPEAPGSVLSLPLPRLGFLMAKALQSETVSRSHST